MHLLAALHMFGVRLAENARAKVQGDPERGSVTMEQVLWAVAVIGIVGVVVAAVTAFVTDQAGNIT